MKLATVKDFLYWEVLNRLKGKKRKCCVLLFDARR